jgi:hypothetical protein
MTAASLTTAAEPLPAAVPAPMTAAPVGAVAAPLPPPVPARDALLSALDEAARASADAHEATRALTDTVLACQHLPAEIYQYAPHLSDTTATVLAAGRALNEAVAAGPDAVRHATSYLTAATAALRSQTAALAAAVAWYSQPAALPSADGS